MAKQNKRPKIETQFASLVIVEYDDAETAYHAYENLEDASKAAAYTVAFGKCKVSVGACTISLRKGG